MYKQTSKFLQINIVFNKLLHSFICHTLFSDDSDDGNAGDPT